MAKRQWPDGGALCEVIKAESGSTVLLSFSRGKDSIGTWLQVRRHFDTVIPYHLIFVPGLAFVEESLLWFERFFGTHIMRIPHPGLYKWLTGYLYQTPHRTETIRAMELPLYTYRDVHMYVAQDQGLNGLKVFTAAGLKAGDNLYRRTMIDVHGPINRNDRKFYPIYDWNNDRLFTEIEQAKCKLPVDYQLFGRSFEGLQYAYIKPIKDRFPEDYAKIVEWFPLVDAEIWRFEHGESPRRPTH
jgi:hypothetical protein